MRAKKNFFFQKNTHLRTRFKIKAKKKMIFQRNKNRRTILQFIQFWRRKTNFFFQPVNWNGDEETEFSIYVWNWNGKYEIFESIFFILNFSLSFSPCLKWHYDKWANWKKKFKKKRNPKKEKMTQIRKKETQYLHK